VRAAAVLEALSRAAFERDIGRIDKRSARMYGWTIIAARYPVLDILFNHATAAPLRLRLTCADWDELPPSIELLDSSGAHLGSAPPNVGNVFNGGAHPSTGRPFVCMRGAREYHIHSSHTSDLWDNYRGASGMDLAGILLQLWKAWKKSVG
jgi:hypothetical protein